MMNVKENLSIEDKKMLRSVFWRSWTINASRTGATQYHAVGVMYTLLPVINRFYKTNEEKATALVRDRKSTRLNSSHANISYAVFCLKKKTRLNSSHSTI